MVYINEKCSFPFISYQNSRYKYSASIYRKKVLISFRLASAQKKKTNQIEKFARPKKKGNTWKRWQHNILRIFGRDRKKKRSSLSINNHFLLYFTYSLQFQYPIKFWTAPHIFSTITHPEAFKRNVYRDVEYITSPYHTKQKNCYIICTFSLSNFQWWG